jgi:hypothetical protein
MLLPFLFTHLWGFPSAFFRWPRFHHSFFLSIPRPVSLPDDEPPPDDGDFSQNDQVPAEEGDVGSSEKMITIVVLISIFGIFVIVILALCCTRRNAIGKPNADPIDPVQHWTVGMSTYTGGDSISQFSYHSETGGRDNRIDL